MGNHSRNANHMGGTSEPPTRDAFDGSRRIVREVAACGIAAAILPAAATIGTPVHAPVWQGVVGVVVAGAAMASIVRLKPAPLPAVGVTMVAVACWLLAQSSYPVVAWLIAPTLGAGMALAVGNSALRSLRPAGAIVAVASGLLIVGMRVLFDRDAAIATGGALLAVGALAALYLATPQILPGRGRLPVAVAGATLALVTVAYVGATTPTVTWFGSLTSHGPRNSDEVAITFDDGPNPPFTLQISAILDRYGAKGTFFTVGKALEARPDVSRALMEDGQLLGNHSYHHDAFSWLDPRYEELDQTEDAFKRTLGVCPALFRPPHGSHTPFMARALGRRGMTMVTWDVSAGDWATTDGELVAQRILEKVRAGSIILLHDGIDGNLGADRSVILTALPIILSGLRERGLKPVTLDRLLGVPGYLEKC